MRAILILILCAHLSLPAADLSAALELVGEPLAGRPLKYRNPWDLSFWQGRLYLTNGDLQDNIGPVDLWCFDPASSTWSVAATVPEEELGQMRHDGAGRPVYAGLDALGSPSFCNWYRCENGTWVQHANAPTSTHVRDLAWWGGRALLAVQGQAAPLVSDDDGATWNPCLADGMPGPEVSVFVPIGERMYGLPTPRPRGDTWFPASHDGMYVDADGSIHRRSGLYREDLFPGYPNIDDGLTAFAWAQLGRVTVYIGRNNIYSYDTLPLVACRCTSLDPGSSDATTIDLPAGESPFAIRSWGGRFLLLVGSVQAGGWRMRLLASEDAINWSEVASFITTTFARTFDISPTGDGYIGLGGYRGSPSGDMGRIYRLPAAALALGPGAADVNGDGVVDAADLALVTQAMGRRFSDAGWNAGIDCNQDQRIDAQDLAMVTRAMAR